MTEHIETIPLIVAYTGTYGGRLAQAAVVHAVLENLSGFFAEHAVTVTIGVPAPAVAPKVRRPRGPNKPKAVAPVLHVAPEL